MPDTVKFSELETATSVGGGDLAALAVEDQQAATGYTSKKATVNNIGLAINNSIEYATALQTTNKTVIGAINELNAGGGGGGSSTLAGLTDVTLTTPAEGQALVYDGTEWVNGDVEGKIAETKSGSIATFDTSLALPLDELKAQIVAQQAGSGTPSPSNPRSISGFDIVNLTRCGKNLLKNSLKSQTHNGVIFTVNSDGTITLGGQATEEAIRTFYIYLPAGSYTYTSEITESFSTYDTYITKDGSVIARGSSINPGQNFTLSEYSRLTFGIRVRNGVSPNITVKPMVRVSTDTDNTFESYNVETIIIALGDTYYGGILDVKNGTATIDKALIVFDGSEDEGWAYNSNYNGFSIPIADMVSGDKLNGLCNWLEQVSSSTGFGFRLGANNKACYCYHITDNISGITDLATWKTYLSNNNLQIVFPLAEPTEITGLTPANFTTIAGEQNIFADCGDVEVEYFSSGASDTVDLIKTTTGIKRTVLHDTWVGFASGDTITLSDDADNYDELIIYASHLENNTYYAHRGIMRVDRESILWSISESAQSEEWRGLIDCIGSFQNNQVYSAFDFRFTDKRTIKSVSKTVGTWPFAQCGIEKIIGVKY